jgi:hypothetical protein
MLRSTSKVQSPLAGQARAEWRRCCGRCSLCGSRSSAAPRPCSAAARTRPSSRSPSGSSSRSTPGDTRGHTYPPWTGPSGLPSVVSGLGAEALRRGVLLSLVSDVASNYFELLGLYRELVIAREASGQQGACGIADHLVDERLPGGTAERLRVLLGDLVDPSRQPDQATHARRGWCGKAEQNQLGRISRTHSIDRLEIGGLQIARPAEHM